MLKTIKDIWDNDLRDRDILGLIVLIILTIFVTIYLNLSEAKQWEIFKTVHNCKIVGRERGHTSTGIAPTSSTNGGVGIVVLSAPDKTGWQCDDGVTYWR